MRTIYCYQHKELNSYRTQLGKNPIYKIGDTGIEAESMKDSALIRIKQQDKESNSEPNVLVWCESVPDDFMTDVEHVDKKFHDFLEHNKGYLKYREDADREWFEFENPDIPKALLHEFLYGSRRLNAYKMRKPQQAAHDKIVEYFKNNNGEFLLAAKMRFGKNFTFLQAVKTLGYKNVLLLTYRPGVFNSLKDDIENHVDFTDFKYISFSDNKDKLTLSDNNVNIVTCSVQMAGYRYNDETNDFEKDNNTTNKLFKKNLKTLASYKWDLIVTDECHYGTTTENFNSICNTLKCSKILYISGTPFKQINEFKDNNLFTYTYLDEQDAEDYKMPKLRQYAIKMDSKLIDYYHKNIEMVDYPNMKKLFQADANGDFKYGDISKQTIKFIIDKLNNTNNGEFKHGLALMDYKDSVKAIVKFINDTYKNIHAIDGSNDIVNVDKLKEIIKRNDNKGIKTITFSCGRFIEGVTISEWNTVIMLQDGASPERYFQAMFRGQSPAEGKEDFYVFDYNPERMLSLNYGFISQLSKCKKSYKNIDKEVIIKEWLKAAPIIRWDDQLSDQQFVEVNYRDIENAYFKNDKIGASKFCDSSLYNLYHNINITQSEIKDITSCLDKSFNGKILNKDPKSVSVNDNGISGAKNRVSVISVNSDNTQFNKPDNKNNKKYSISELVALVKNHMHYISRYIVIYNCQNTSDIIKTLEDNIDNNQLIFERSTGITNYQVFKIIIDKHIIKEDEFNYSISQLWEELNKVSNMDANTKYATYKRWNLFNYRAIPQSICDNIINDIDSSIFKNKNIKICDLTIENDYIINILIDKFMDGLSNDILDRKERNNYILNNIIYACTTSDITKRIITKICNIKNIYSCQVKNKNIEYIDNMPKFDYIVQNPPYSGTLHIDFFNKGLDLLNKNGKMIIIEPATWLVNIRKNGNAKTIYEPLKNRIKNHVSKIIVDNYTKEFNIRIFAGLSITNIDLSKEYDTIDYSICGYKQKVNSVYDCNLIGEYNTIWSILNKLLSYKDMVSDHLYKKDNIILNDQKYLQYNFIGVPLITARSHGNRFDELFSKYYYRLCGYSDVLDELPKNKNGDEIKYLIQGTKEELENYKHLVYNTNLPIFLSYVLTIDQNNNVLPFIPWLVDKKYTTEEIYKLFKFTDDEISLIEKTCKKYSIESVFAKRMYDGPSSEITDDEVKDYIDNL